VAQAAAKRMVPVILELGGSDPMIVFEDANLERAANAAVWGRFTNAGQSCNAVKRLLVHESVAADLREKLRAKAGALKNSDNPYEREIIPLINERQLRLIQSQCDDSIKEGALVLLGGGMAPGRGHFFEPTLLDASNDVRALREETFGPVLTIQTFHDEEEAVRLANSTQYGLGAAIFTRDKARAGRVAARIQAGSVTINDVMTNFAALELPFGGAKSSGLGFAHGGAEGLRAFTRRKSILINRWGLNTELYWYPYSEKKFNLLSKLLGLLNGPLKFLS